MEKAGEYEAACEALSEFWPERDGLPNLNDLDEPAKALVLLRVGALSGWRGSTDQAPGSQESAKDLITESIRIFERLGRTQNAAEAHGDLALCYWREGSYDEARIHLTDALSLLENENSDLKAVLLIRAGIVEVWAQKLNEGLSFYNQAARLLDRSEDHALKGTFHNEYGSVFRQLAAPENREDYLDRALMEYTAASFHFELAGNSRYLARVRTILVICSSRLGNMKKHTSIWIALVTCSSHRTMSARLPKLTTLAREPCWPKVTLPKQNVLPETPYALWRKATSRQSWPKR